MHFLCPAHRPMTRANGISSQAFAVDYNNPGAKLKKNRKNFSYLTYLIATPCTGVAFVAARQRGKVSAILGCSPLRLRLA